jgi:hypothetical protein
MAASSDVARSRSGLFRQSEHHRHGHTDDRPGQRPYFPVTFGASGTPAHERPLR